MFSMYPAHVCLAPELFCKSGVFTCNADVDRFPLLQINRKLQDYYIPQRYQTQARGRIYIARIIEETEDLMGQFISLTNVSFCMH